MSMEINWYHVFDSTNSLWLSDASASADCEHDWSRHYRDASEFSSYDDAYSAALQQIKGMGPVSATVIVIADCGTVET